MWETLSQWEAKYVVTLASVIAFSVTVVAVAISVAWKRVKLAGIEADLKRDAIDRGLSLEQIERLINGPEEIDEPVDDKSVEADLASLLVQYEVPSATLEQILRLFQSSPSQSKPKIYEAINEMLEADATGETLLTAVRSLCQPGRPSERPIAFAPQ